MNSSFIMIDKPLFDLFSSYLIHFSHCFMSKLVKKGVKLTSFSSHCAYKVIALLSGEILLVLIEMKALEMYSKKNRVPQKPRNEGKQSRRAFDWATRSHDRALRLVVVHARASDRAWHARAHVYRNTTAHLCGLRDVKAVFDYFWHISSFPFKSTFFRQFLGFAREIFKGTVDWICYQWILSRYFFL